MKANQGFEQPWTASQATRIIREIAANLRCDLFITEHVEQRIDERNLILSDLLHVLKNGMVYEPAQKSTREGFYKYQMECRTPNSDSRVIRVVVVPDRDSCQLKIVTIMWKD